MGSESKKKRKREEKEEAKKRKKKKESKKKHKKKESKSRKHDKHSKKRSKHEQKTGAVSTCAPSRDAGASCLWRLACLGGREVMGWLLLVFLGRMTRAKGHRRVVWCCACP